MNEIFCVVWSKALNKWVVASEFASGRKKAARSASASAVVFVLMAGPAFQASAGTVCTTSATGGDVPTANGGGSAFACGYMSKANKNWSVAVGTRAVANGTESVALGNQVTAGGDQSIALGAGASTTKAGSSAIGYQAISSGMASTALGQHTEATKDHTVAIGTWAKAKGLQSVALGNQSLSEGDYATALGAGASAKASQSTAVGYQASTTGMRALALGYKAESTQTYATALGTEARATALEATAIGNESKAQGLRSIALGSTTQSTADYGSALGYQASATNANDVAIGSYSKTSAAVATPRSMIRGTNYNFAGAAPTSSVSVGNVGIERTVTNVAAGRISATSTDAINGSQLHATNQAIENLTTNGSAGFNVTAQGANSSKVYADETVNLKNTDGNVVVSKDVNVEDVNFDLAKDLKVDSVTAGNSKLDTNGLTIVGGPSVTDNGIDAGGKPISNVGPGTAPGDAVNKNQLDAVNATASAGFN
ncbi:ESPR-type extended signal peptide-containing protein, partial [Pseudomonas sp. CGJS7]|uniref:ESPR-type extended signal peptide-containing protein n=1 Tax=Pseudomonas sp. CGJS7 TaxID=3109348 RepID=UPI00300A463D